MFSPELGEFFDYKDGAFARETDSKGWTPLYTTPPQRKPLTDEEIFSIWRKQTDLDVVRHTPYEDDGIGFARAIEAAHNIKENT